VAVQQLRDESTVGCLEGNAANLVDLAGGLDPHCTRPHELAEVRQVVVKARGDDLLPLPINHHHRMLPVIGPVLVDLRDQARPMEEKKK
jgi:hypothetical protein